jgi:hypothetical protein
MGNIHSVAQLADFIKHHPGLSALATSTVAAPLLGLWTHSGAPVPGYGRLLTQAEAHDLPVQYAPEALPSPNIPPVSIFGHPHTISYSAAPPHLLSKSSNTNATIELSPATAAQAFSLAGALTVVLGTAAVVTLCTSAFNKWSHKKKTISNADLIAFLQLELQNAKTHIEITRKDLINAQDDLLEAQANLNRVKKTTTANTTGLARYRTQKIKLIRQKLAQEKEIRELRRHQEELLEQLDDLQEGMLDVQMARDKLEQQDPTMKLRNSTLQLEIELHLAAFEHEKEESRYNWSWVQFVTAARAEWYSAHRTQALERQDTAKKLQVNSLQLEMGLRFAASELEEESRYGWSWIQFVTTAREEWYSAHRAQALTHKDTTISSLRAEKDAMSAKFGRDKDFILKKLRESARSNEGMAERLATITKERSVKPAKSAKEIWIDNWWVGYIAQLEEQNKRLDDLQEELEVCEEVDIFQIKQIESLELKLEQESKLRSEAEEQLKQKSNEILELQSQRKLELVHITKTNTQEVQTVTENLDHGIKLQNELKEQLMRKEGEVVELRSKHDVELEVMKDNQEEKLVQIRDLEQEVERSNIGRTNAQNKLDELQQMHQATSDELQKTYQATLDALQKTQRAALEQKDRDIQSIRDENDEASRAETSSLSKKGKDKSDRLVLAAPIKWTSRNQREAWKWAVRVGIVQQGPYPEKQLIPLQLPFADPFYSDLPLALPKSRDDSYDGEKHDCKTCEQTYTRNDLLNHIPFCSVFFSQHAAICEHCHEVFVQDTAFREHEKQCAGPEFGTHPDVLNALPSIDEFNILGASVSKLAPSPTAAEVMQLKITTLGDTKDEVVVRALLPYADKDYAACGLPKPTKQNAILPDGFNGDFYAMKKLCYHCKEWYIAGAEFHSHLKICTPFFCGHNKSPAHARCQHCGEHFRMNAGFDEHKNLCQKKASKAPCVFCNELFDYNDAARNKHSVTCHKNPARVSIPPSGTSKPDAQLPASNHKAEDTKSPAPARSPSGPSSSPTSTHSGAPSPPVHAYGPLLPRVHFEPPRSGPPSQPARTYGPLLPRVHFEPPRSGPPSQSRNRKQPHPPQLPGPASPQR